MALKQQKLVEQAKKLDTLKSAVSTNAKGMEQKSGEAKESYRAQRKYC